MLGQADIVERTNTVIKMANATGDAAKDVSSYMTAIWNNYANGADNLEHFGDVITALGATTASSSSEIAEGLEKFAAIGDTIGLSYDYATSILSAVVANTRQTADVVGTALRTIFARIQGLNLGETLDDGVTLNKYSKALENVGVKVLDLNGELRAADDILDDVASKWETLSGAQQTALAQTVAGTRQYSQFVAVMENWGDVQRNLLTASTADGTLQKQADIYAESWGAAKDRAKASIEGLYDSLLSDDFFIGITNGFGDLIDILGEVSDAIGGLGGVMKVVGGIFLSKYAKEVPTTLMNWKANIQAIFGTSQSAIRDLQGGLDEYLKRIKDIEASDAFKLQAEGIARVNAMNKELAENLGKLSKAEQETYQQRIKNVEVLYDELGAIQENLQAVKKLNAAREEKIYSNIVPDYVQKSAKTFNTAQSKYAEAKAKREDISGRLAIAEKGNNTEKVKNLQTQLKSVNNEIAKWETNLRVAKQTLEGDLTKAAENLGFKLRKAFSVQEYVDRATQLVKEEASFLKTQVAAENEIERQQRDANGMVTSWIKQADTAKKTPELAAKMQADMISYAEEAKNREVNYQYKGKNGRTYNADSVKVFDIKKLNSIITALDRIDVEGKDAAVVIQDLLKIASGLQTTDDSTGALNIRQQEALRERRQRSQERVSNASNTTEGTALGEGYKQEDRAQVSYDNTRDLADKESESGQVSKIPDNRTSFEKSATAISEYASALMFASTAMSAISDTGETLTSFLKGEASAFELVTSAIMAASMSGMAYNSIKDISNTLTDIGIVKRGLEYASLKLTAAGFEEVAIAEALAGKGAAGFALNLGVVLAPIVAFLGAAKLLSFTIDSIDAYTHRFENRLAEAQATSNGLQTELANTKTRVEELKSAFDEYDSIQDQLRNCVEGTQEWNEALTQANQHVLDLLTKYPQLNQYVRRNDNGSLEIDQEGKDTVTKSLQTVTDNLYKATLMQNAVVAKAQSNLTEDEVAKSTGIDKEILKEYGTSLVEMTTEEIDNFINSGAIDRGWRFAGTNEAYRENQSKAIKNAINNGSLAKYTNTRISEDSVNQINKDEIARLIKEENPELDIKDVGAAVGSSIYENLYKEAHRNVSENQYTDAGISEGMVKSTAKQYLDALGVGYEKGSIGYNNETGEVSYTNLQGEEEKVLLNTINAFQATSDASSKLAERLEAVAPTLKGLENADTDSAKAQKTMLVEGNLDNATKKQVDALRKEISKNPNFYEDNWEAYGAKSAKEMQAGWQEAMANFDTGYDDAVVDTLNRMRKIGIRDAGEAKKEQVKAAKEAGITDFTQEQFGNIDLDNRKVLNWTTDVIDKYREQLESLNYNPDELLGSISTVMGSSSSYTTTKGQEIEVAYSPLLQTSQGAVPLNQDAIDTYITRLFEIAGDDISEQELINLDAEGLIVNGTKISNIIAAVGDNARAAGEQMHYLGKEGAIALAGREDVDYNAIAPGSLKAIQDNLGKIDIGPLGKQGGDEYLEGFYQALSGLDESQTQEVAEALSSIDFSSTDSIKKVKEQIFDLNYALGISAEEFDNWATQVQKALVIIPDFSAVTANTGLMLNASNMNVGETLDKDSFEALQSAANFDISDYFYQDASGAYVLTANLANLKTALEETAVDMAEYRSIQSGINSDDSALDNLLLSSTADLDNTIIPELRQALSDLYNSEYGDDLLNKLGYTKDRINELVYNGSKEELLAVANAAKELLNGDYSNEAMSNAVITSINSTKELQSAWEKGMVTAEDFNKKFSELKNTLDEDLNADTVEDVADQLQKAARASKDFDKSLEGNREGAEDTAKELLRYSDSVEDVLDNYDDWIAAVKELGETGEGGLIDPDLLDSIADALGDMLNIDASSLSNGFLTDANTLQLMKEAAEGSAEAYDKLAEAANQDILTRYNIDVDDTEFWAAKDRVEAAIDGLNWETIQVGADIDDANFLNALSEMVNAADMTAQDATTFLSNMGIDAEVKQATAEQEEIVATAVTPQPVTRVQQGTNPATGEVQDYTFVGVEYTPTPIKATKTLAATGLEVTSARKSSGGDVKARAQKQLGAGNNAKRAAKKSGGGGGKGKKGGGGGGGSKKTKDPIEDLPDAFHDITRQLQRLEYYINKVDKKQSHLYGDDLISSLKETNGLLEQQYKLYKEMDTVLESEKTRLEGLLKQYGVEFEKSTGEILNYTETFIKAKNEYNAAIAKYNASAQDKAAEKALEAAQKKWDKYNDLIKEHEEVLDKQIDHEEAKLENLYKRIENSYKAWNTRFEVSLNLNSARKEWKSFWQKVQEDVSSIRPNYDKQLEGFKDLFKNDLTAIKTNLAQVADIRDNIQQFLDNSSDTSFHTDIYATRSEAVNDYIEKTDSLRDSAKQLFEQYQDSLDKYLDKVDDVVDRWDELIDKFDKINDQLDHQAKVIKLLYGETDAAKRFNSEVYEAQAQNQLATMRTLNAEITALQKEREELIAAGRDETQKDVQALTKAIDNAQNSMNNQIENYLETLTNQFRNTVTLALDSMEKELAGGSTFTKLSNRWEDAQNAAAGYYDDIERIYQLESLESKWTSAINSTSNIKSQQKLSSLMEAQLENLKSRTDLREYDVELAERQLAVAQAQIALEEAQNAKNSMKLVRDANGNWTYQYIADANEVEEKQQALIDANNEWYEYTKQGWKDLTQEILENVQTAQDKLSELMLEYNTADSSRRKEIFEEFNYLYDYYYGEEGLIAKKSALNTSVRGDVNQALSNNLMGFYHIDEDAMSQMTREEQSLMKDMLKKNLNVYNLLLDTVAGKDGIYEQLAEKCEDINDQSIEAWNGSAANVIEKWSTDPDSVEVIVTEAYEKIKRAQSDFDYAVKAGTSASGVQYTRLSSQISTIASMTSVAEQKTRDLKNATDSISSSLKVVQDLASQWKSVAEQIERAIEDYEEMLKLMQQQPVVPEQNPNSNFKPYDIVGEKAERIAEGLVYGGSPYISDVDGSEWYKQRDGRIKVYNPNYDAWTYNITPGIAGSGTQYENEVLANISSSSGLSSSEKSALKTVGTTVASTLAGSSVTGVLGTLVGIAKKTSSSGSSSGSSSKSSSGSSGSSSGTASKVGKAISTIAKAVSTKKFATGGYTGEWDDGSGKLAFLHSKELVLNAKDTENMLEAVDMIRAIASAGSTVSSVIDKSLIGMMYNMTGLSPVTGNNSSFNQLTDSNVFNINAEFPNANDADSIREAILSLPNYASQYLQKRKL